MPVLILTARDRWNEKVEGFDSGADDYVAKPFSMEELLARLRALIRRAAGHATAELVCGPVRLDTRSSQVSLDGAPIALTAHEFKLLSYLMHHQRRVVSRSELVEHIYEQDFDRDSNTVEVFVGRCDGSISAEIRGDGGFGYDPIFIPDESQDGRTFAEMTNEEKSTLSHRSRALSALFDYLNVDGA